MKYKTCVGMTYTSFIYLKNVLKQIHKRLTSIKSNHEYMVLSCVLFIGKMKLKLKEDIDFDLNFFLHLDSSLISLILVCTIPFITLL